MRQYKLDFTKSNKYCIKRTYSELIWRTQFHWMLTLLCCCFWNDTFEVHLWGVIKCIEKLKRLSLIFCLIKEANKAFTLLIYVSVSAVTIHRLLDIDHSYFFQLIPIPYSQPSYLFQSLFYNFCCPSIAVVSFFCHMTRTLPLYFCSFVNNTFNVCPSADFLVSLFGNDHWQWHGVISITRNLPTSLCARATVVFSIFNALEMSSCLDESTKSLRFEPVLNA